jgi:hypothetical protein
MGIDNLKEYMRDAKEGLNSTANYIKKAVKNPSIALSDFKDVLRRTSLEIAIGAVILGTAAGIGSSIYESKRDRDIQLAFSEITQIENDAHYLGKKIPVATHYLGCTNDIVMNVLECSNSSYDNFTGKQSMKKFASELEMFMDPALAYHHHPLYKMLKEVPENSRELGKELEEFNETRNELSPVEGLFNSSWNEDRDDSYHSEPYECGSTDSDGNYQSETCYREVYDYSDYTHTYYKDIGNKASKSLEELLKKHPDLRYKQELKIASQTNAEGEYAIERTAKLKNKDVRLTNEELRKISATWKYGSTFYLNGQEIINNWSLLKNKNPNWKNVKDSIPPVQENRKYTTSWPGPEEYQLCKNISNNCNHVQNLIDEIFDSMNMTQAEIPLLERDIKEIIAIEMDKKKGNSRAVYKSIMERSRKIYHKNFKNGLDVEGGRNYVILISTLAGIVAGALAGAGVDKLADNYNLWEARDYRGRKKREQDYF